MTLVISYNENDLCHLIIRIFLSETLYEAVKKFIHDNSRPIRLMNSPLTVISSILQVFY